MRFSAALCRGLIEARGGRRTDSARSPAFSAALCRGLIEATLRGQAARRQEYLFSAALCRGLIEAMRPPPGDLILHAVFRGFMPRPH